MSASEDELTMETRPTRLTRGMMFGALAAIGYTAANVFLRSVSDYNSAWVSGVKSLWTFSLCIPWLVAPWLKGQRVFPSAKMTLWLVLAAVMGQFGGNLAFQFSLRQIGLAISVPLCLGTMITSSAIVGSVWGREPLRRSVLISIPVFLLAITLLSSGRMVETAQQDLDVENGSLIWVIVGCCCAALSGLAYSILGFVIRRCTHDEIPIVTPMAIVAMVGTVGLCSLGAEQLGVEGVSAIPLQAWFGMSLAGVVNAAAFYALTVSLKILPVLYVHLVNSSQVAMAAIAGALIFGEPVTLLIGIGVVLTVLGFLVMSSESQAKASTAAD